jgi:antitoxin YefM
MLAVNYSTLRNNLKDYCDRATDNNETVIVTRKDEKNVVILSLESYNAISKAARNAAYLSGIDESRRQLTEGKTYTFTIDELLLMENMSIDEMTSFVEKRKDF